METILDAIRETIIAYLGLSMLIGVLLIAMLLMLFMIVRAPTVVTEDEYATQRITEWYGKSIEEIIEHNEEEIIEHNEELIRSDPGWGFGGTPEIAAKLITHPTIKCRWYGLGSREDSTMGMYYHDQKDRPAIWRRDMTYPECRSCYIEDLYV